MPHIYINKKTAASILLLNLVVFEQPVYIFYSRILQIRCPSFGPTSIIKAMKNNLLKEAGWSVPLQVLISYYCMYSLQ